MRLTHPPVGGEPAEEVDLDGEVFAALRGVQRIAGGEPVAVERITDEAVAAMDAADLDTGPAADALMHMLDAGAQVTGRYPVLLRLISAHPVSPEADHDRHAPVTDRIRRVIQRGRQTGEFDDRLPVDWLVAATIRLGHAASEEQDAGRLSATAAEDALRTSLLRMLGATAQAGSSPQPR